MEWLVLLSCIIVIEFVKNSRNLLVYFDFTSFVLRFEKNLQKPEGTAHLPQATASSMFGKSEGIPLELPSDKVMCHACHVCHQNVTCIAASGTSYVFLWVVIFLCPKFRLGFWWFIGSSVSQDISSLYKTIAEWLKVELRFAGDPSSIKASRFGHVSGIRELHLKRGRSETLACWICWVCACPKHGTRLRFLKVSWCLGSSEIQNSTILKWFRASVENLSIRSFFRTFISHGSHCGLHQL